jgi:hypothetical protein
MVTPPGRLQPAVLAAAHAAGVSEIWRVGGAQAVAALAYGAGPIRPVDKIVGPGNAWVTAAKRRVYGQVGIDALAGPSEIVVVADAANDPAWIAADLLSQAEHDPAAQSILITDDAAFADRVIAQVEAQLKTLAVFNGNDYEISGLKWLITGANGAKTWIIMANVPENPHGPHGPTLFLCEGDTPGIHIERVMDSMDRNYVEGHAVVRFDGLRLGPTQVLGEVGNALRYAQMRLAPARLTHCMRWLGAAARAQHIALEHAKVRTAFGKALAEHQGVNFMLADNEIAMHQCRLAIRHTAWLLDRQVRARHESSIVKAFVSEELFKVADRCVQILGGIGVTGETVVEMIFRDMRGFRLYDGPTEVHKFAIATQLLRSGTAFANPT